MKSLFYCDSVHFLSIKLKLLRTLSGSGRLWTYTTNHKRVSIKVCMVGHYVESPLSPLMTSNTIRYGCGPGAGGEVALPV